MCTMSLQVYLKFTVKAKLRFEWKYPQILIAHVITTIYDSVNETSKMAVKTNLKDI